MSPANEPRERLFEGVHCTLKLEVFACGVVVLRIAGTDVGEFADAPMATLAEWLGTGQAFEFFIDARDARGPSIEVSSDWAHWLGKNKARLRSVTMLTGSRFVQLTAEFVRRFAALEGSMRICTQPDVFDQVLEQALRTPGE